MADTDLECPNKTVGLSAPKSDVLISNSAPVVFTAGPYALENRDHAPSDGRNMITLEDVERVMSRIMAFDKLAKNFVAEES